MTYAQQRELHSRGKISIKRSFFPNNLPSATDPTQDVPIKDIQLGLNGEPLNVRRYPANYGLKAGELTTIDKRNNDKFDVVGELQASQRSVSKIITDLKRKENETKID